MNATTSKLDHSITVRLSRRNLEALLKKLDHNRAGGAPRSEVTIARETDAGLLIVVGEEDAEHYGERQPGEMLDNATGRLY